MWWCEECEEAMEYEDAKIEREYYEAWGHEFSTEDLVCPHCGTSLVEYRGQDIRKEEEMSDLHIAIDEVSEKICKQLCKYSDDDYKNHGGMTCEEYRAKNGGKCCVEELLEEAGLA